MEKIFKRYKKDISLIIHCAAQPSHDYGKNYPLIDFNVNALGTLNLLELTKKYTPNSHLFLCQQIKFMVITQIDFSLKN